MFNQDEKEVLRALHAFMNTIRPLDGGRYDTVVVPIPLLMRLINFHDAHSNDPVLEPDELRTDPKAASVPPPPEVERAMRTLAKIWEPQVVSCSHCSAHMAIQEKNDLENFITLHEKCGDREQHEFRGYIGGDPSGGELPPEGP